jgi:hypothetical protein
LRAKHVCIQTHFSETCFPGWSLKFEDTGRHRTTSACVDLSQGQTRTAECNLAYCPFSISLLVLEGLPCPNEPRCCTVCTPLLFLFHPRSSHALLRLCVCACVRMDRFTTPLRFWLHGTRILRRASDAFHDQSNEYCFSRLNESRVIAKTKALFAFFPSRCALQHDEASSTRCGRPAHILRLCCMMPFERATEFKKGRWRKGRWRAPLRVIRTIGTFQGNTQQNWSAWQHGSSIPSSLYWMLHDDSTLTLPCCCWQILRTSAWHHTSICGPSIRCNRFLTSERLNNGTITSSLSLRRVVSKRMNLQVRSPCTLTKRLLHAHVFPKADTLRSSHSVI